LHILNELGCGEDEVETEVHVSFAHDDPRYREDVSDGEDDDDLLTDLYDERYEDNRVLLGMVQQQVAGELRKVENDLVDVGELKVTEPADHVTFRI
jgi:DNA-directed RNA polymerase subunit N (RpoN/RPB10)